MKKVFLLLALVASMGLANAQTKIGHINSSSLIELMPEADTVAQILDKAKLGWQTMLNDKEAEYNKKYEALVAASNVPGADQTMLEVQAKEVEQIQVSYQETQAKAQQALAQQQQQLLQPLIDKITAAIKKVAEANGYDYVMDSMDGSGMLYKNPSNDLMPLVKKELGIL